MNKTSRIKRPALQRYAVSAAIVILIGGATHKVHAIDWHADNGSIVP